jgi:hypothetical protein
MVALVFLPRAPSVGEGRNTTAFQQSIRRIFHLLTSACGTTLTLAAASRRFRYWGESWQWLDMA